MITLITGTPGAGKTSWVVAELEKLSRVDSRAVYTHGIPDLLLPHLDSEDVQDWHNWLPDGALLVIDEVQSVWRPRKSGSIVPASVQALETHRHRGIDLWLITQAPQLVDANVRRLISRHVHLRATALGRYQYEWAECHERIEDTSKAARRRYKLPKHIFGLYKSASVHTKIKRRLPTAVYVLGAVLLVAGVLGFRVYNRADQLMKPKELMAIAREPAGSAGPAGGAASLRPIAAPVKSTVDYSAAAFVPRNPVYPESAPVYDNVARVAAVPHVAGCISSATRCQCYTQQVTKIVMSDKICRDYVAGRIFQPFVADSVVAPAVPVSAAVSDSEPVQEMGLAVNYTPRRSNGNRWE